MGFLPFSMTPARSASACFCTSSEARSFTFIFLPAGVSPLPSAPWQEAHFDLYTSAVGSAANAETDITKAIARTTSDARKSVFILSSPDQLKGREIPNGLVAHRVPDGSVGLCV